MTLFDECFHTIVDSLSIPHSYDEFWESSIDSLKKIPFNLKVSRKKNKIFNKYIEYEILFEGIDKYPLSGKLFLPVKSNYNPPIIIRFSDYMEEEKFLPELYDNGFGQFILELRGHKEAREIRENSEEKTKSTYGYFSENLEQINDYYMKKLYLDAYRTLEVIRLIKEVDKNKITIWGKGIGAAMAVFLQNHVDRILSLILQQPAFAYLELTQNISKSTYAEEINQYIKKNKFSKKKIKENLSYFDVIYLADKINIPVMMVINMENTDSAPQGAFAFFHRIPENKDMVLYNKADESSESDDKKILSDILQFFIKTLR
jgi:cephalosporin-C deacetylase